jgi:hypothetical protein
MIDRDQLPVRTTPRGTFGALIRCECGHAIGAHTARGCTVGVYAACGCRLSDGAALAGAIGRASRPQIVATRDANRPANSLDITSSKLQ